MLAQVNATLRSVGGGGLSEEAGADRDAGADAPKFAGAADAYYRERQERVTVGNDRQVLVRRTVIVDTRDPAIAWAEDDVVELELETGETVTGKIQTIEGSRLGDAAATGVETTRLELEPK